MPSVIAAAVASYAAGAVAGAVASAVVYSVTYAAVSFATSSIASSLFGKSSQNPSTAGTTNSFQAKAQSRTQTVRSSIEPMAVVYGEVMKSGPLVYANSTGSNKQFLHLVVALAAHEVEAIDSIYLNDNEIRSDQTDANGNVTSGRFNGIVRIKKHLGTDDQVADSDLLSTDSNWTSNHRLRGIAYVYVRLKFDRDKFPTGIPNIKAIVRGKKIYDPRTSTTYYSANPALIARDYLTSSYGLNAPSVEIDSTATIAAANTSDEFVDVTNVVDTFTATASTDMIALSDTLLDFKTGDRVQVSTTGTLPAGLSPGTDYYFISTGRGYGKFATSYKNALVHTAIDITDAGSGTHTVTKTGQVRYDANGVVTLDTGHAAVMEDIMTSCAGITVYTQGVYKTYVGAATTAQTDVIDSTWLRTGITVRPKVSRDNLFNTVRGTFIDPVRSWQPTDFPAQENSTYETEDGGEQLPRNIELPFTTDVVRAQRLAKIHLEKSRQGITVELKCNLKALQFGVWDVVKLTFSQFGWTEKEFRITEWTRTEDDGIDLVLQEESSASYSWNSGDATTIDPAPDTELAPALNVVAPGTPTLTEELYTTTNSAGVKSKATLTWGASDDAYLSEYQLEYKLSTDSTWIIAGRTANALFDLFDTTPGTYDFRVKAINEIGVSSDYATNTSLTVKGLSAPPADLTGLTISSIGGNVVLRWTRSTDLDVIIGGKVQFRHHKNQSGATWSTSVGIGEAVPGGETIAVLPAKEGTYLARFYDSSGVPSEGIATVSTKAATVLTFANVTSISEHPTFSGTKTNTYVDGTDLELTGATNIDDWGNVDDVVNWDYEGDVASSGTYDFAAGIDLGSVSRVRLSTTIAATIVNDLDDVDSRTANIDSWEDFDGSAGGNADCQIWVRETDDDPTGSPVWSDWQRLESAEFNARAFDFQARLSSDDPAYNIHVTELTVTVDEVV